jgi:murein DD-endopeptidase MepM/ murein hydrolase activator NlpD
VAHPGGSPGGLTRLNPRVSRFLAVGFFAVLTMALTDCQVAWAKTKRRPAQLQCWGKGVETYGHALVLSPKLKKPLKKKERQMLSILGGQDPVLLTRLESSFPEATKRYVLDIKLSDNSSAVSFNSLKNFAMYGKFTGPVGIRAATIVDKGDETAKDEIRKLVKELDGIDLREWANRISHKWTTFVEKKNETIVLQIDLQDKTVLAAIQYNDGTEDCLTLDLDAQRPILAEGVDPAIIPENYLFNLPVAPPFEVSYFYGPRIFNSMNVSIGMERSPPKKPKSVYREPKGSLEYLNKYWHYHSGIDFSVMAGTHVYAPYDGHVFAMGQMGCAGNTLVVAHTISGSNNLIFSVYEHLMGPSHFAKVVVKNGIFVRNFRPGEKLARGEKTRALRVGDPVYQGAFLAKSGASGTKIGFAKGFKQGCVGGAHLHFELRVPDENSRELAKEFAFGNKSKSFFDMGLRFRFVNVNTVAVNPADFIHGIDASCQARKELEVKNAKLLRAEDKKAVPPLTAGLCSLKYENALKKLPPIYKLTRQKVEIETPVPLRNPASRNIF